MRLTARIRAFFRVPTGLGIVLLALSVGLAGGSGAILFRFLIAWFHTLFFSGSARLLPGLGETRVILLPAIGLVLVSLMVRRWAPEAEGHGVPEVQYAVRRKGGQIRARVAAVKSFASAICIGSGGSVGREGPIVQIGSSVGSVLARLVGLPDDGARLLVACGAAAGIGGTFNAPIAGVMFAMEVILGSFTTRSFGLVVLASVAATALVQAVLGKEPAFALREIFELANPRELPLYMLLGVLAGGLSVLYVRAFYGIEHAFHRWFGSGYRRALIGGVCMGLIGYLGMQTLWGAHLFGVGYEDIQQVLRLGQSPEHPAQMTAVILLSLVGMKILATSTTLAAGGSGGVFAPCLYVGAMAGGAFGLTVNTLFPAITAPAGAYALVGMGAVFAGAAHAPISSILILFEMTDDYQIILPLMLAVVLSYLISSRINPDSIYTIKLRYLGGFAPIETHGGSVLDLIRVTDAMTPEFHPVSPEAPLAELISRFREEQMKSLPVIDGRGIFLGLLTPRAVQDILIQGDWEGRIVRDVMTPEEIRCSPEDSLREVLHRLSDQEIDSLAVVDKHDSNRLVGLLKREHILWAIGELARENTRLWEQTRKSRPRAQQIVEIPVDVTWAQPDLCFRRLRQIDLPTVCLITRVQRGDRFLIPGGETVLEPGDRMTLVTTGPYETRLRDWIARMRNGSPES